MRIDKDHAVGLRQAGEVLPAFHEFARALAVGGSFLGHSLIEAHRRASAGVPQQKHLRDSRLFPQEFDSLLNIQCVRFPVHCGFVVIRTGIHAEHHEPARRKLPGRDVVHEVARSMRYQNRDMRSGA